MLIRKRNSTRALPRLSFVLIAVLAFGLASADNRAPRIFRVWMFSDAHADTDQRNGRESLATALRQSESIKLCLGLALERIHPQQDDYVARLAMNGCTQR